MLASSHSDQEPKRVNKLSLIRGVVLVALAIASLVGCRSGNKRPALSSQSPEIYPTALTQPGPVSPSPASQTFETTQPSNDGPSDSNVYGLASSETTYDQQLQNDERESSTVTSPRPSNTGRDVKPFYSPSRSRWNSGSTGCKDGCCH